MTDNEQKLTNKIRDIMLLAEPANSNVNKNKLNYIATAVCGGLLVATLFFAKSYIHTEPIDIASLNNINNSIKIIAECENKTSSIVKLDIKRKYNIYAIEKISQQMADKILEELQNRICR